MKHYVEQLYSSPETFVLLQLKARISVLTDGRDVSSAWLRHNTGHVSC
jgi:hypothetical protein